MHQSQPNVCIYPAISNHKEKLQDICNSWTNKIEVEGSNFDETYIADSLEHKYLPPIEDASKEHHYFMVIEIDKQIVGFFDMYLGYPSHNVAWIGMFLIDQAYQKKSYGTLAMQYIERFVKEKGYCTMQLGVYHTNVKGLSFWIHTGFNHIQKFVHDKETQRNILVLEKQIL
ncbi:acetyltransferase (GNAT) family protein [Breznakia blatticola]|uniref:Acetyltransferase (GNAT) family protein n=1 Tax=Breznakia blatticola TaxID=1754012 RepID=A0A4R7Z8Z8_9FIRM|nr:GNAT family N-acetyltransferase [Breznakia blatticola]TDW13206.1 acetyltransferase (GNAT) family protein [Breznakia blatticola]